MRNPPARRAAAESDVEGQAGPRWLREELRQCVQTLAAIERGSASEGERSAAEWIAVRFAEHGLHGELEGEPAHGGYWWPLGLLNALPAALALWHRRAGGLTSRLTTLLAGSFAAFAIWDEVGGGRQWFRRSLLPSKRTWNVLAQAGDPSAERTLLIVAHHDAAHSGLVFHPALPRLAAGAFPRLHERSSHSAPIMYATWLGPVLAVLGALTASRKALAAAGALGAGAAAAMLNIGMAQVVPGANDNLSAVAVLVALARLLREQPLEGVRVLLLSTGSEESFMEGMQGFMRRHGGELDPDRTTVLCLECLGSPTLTLLEGEGMLRMRNYDEDAKAALAAAAEQAGVPVMRGLKTVAATDALVALRRGLRSVTLASVDQTKFPANYHWPSDTPENLHWETLEQAFAVVQAFVRSAGERAEAS